MNTYSGTMSTPDNRSEDVEQIFRQEARKLSSKKERPTLDDVADYYKAANDLSVPNFGEQYEREKTLNTKTFQEIVKAMARILGIAMRDIETGPKQK